MDAVGSGGGLNRFGAWVGQIVTFFAYSLTTAPLGRFRWERRFYLGLRRLGPGEGGVW